MGKDNNLEKARMRYIPMSETMLYILFSLKQERHGYAIMQFVKELTKGRIILGAGTVYSSIGKLERDGLIKGIREKERRKSPERTGNILECFYFCNTDPSPLRSIKSPICL